MVSVPTPSEPGASVPPSAMVTLPPIVPIPPSVAPEATLVRPVARRLVAVHQQRAGADGGRAGIAVGAGQPVVPEPSWVSAPVPETVPAKVTRSERLKASVPLLATLPAMLPVVPPAPICSVPAAMVVPPL